MTQQEAKDYDRLTSACNIYQELRHKYRRLTSMSMQVYAVMQFAQSPSDIQRLQYCVRVFEELIGADWYDK